MGRRWMLAFATAGILSGCAKVVVVPVPEGGQKLTDEGIFYALPSTIARIAMKASKDVSASARFARFAPIFAPGSAPPCGKIKDCAALEGKPGETTKYSLQQGATFATLGEPDPKHVYMVKFTGGGALDQALSMTWNDAGLLASASASVTNRTTDIVVSGVKLATSLYAKGLAAGGGDAAVANAWVGHCPGLDGKAMASGSPNDQWIIRLLLLADSEIKTNVLVANYCDLPEKDRTDKDENSRDDYNETRDKPALELALRAYTLRVQPLISQRTTLLTAQSLSVLDPVKYLEKIDPAIDEQLKSLFIGTKSTATWDLSFDVRDLEPREKPTEPLKLLGLNEKEGLCFVDELRSPESKPMPDDFQKVVVSCDKTLSLATAYYPAQGAQVFSRVSANVDQGSGDRSFRYRLPAQVKADLRMGDKSYGVGLFSVAQLGVVMSLPAKRNSKTLTYDLGMIEATGGLKSFKLGTTGGLDASTIDALAGAGGTVIDARAQELKAERDRRDKASTAADELTVLTRQQTILKLKDEICELQKKYGLACTVQP